MKKQGKQLAVALGFALVAAWAAGAVYHHRDELFEWEWARVHGHLDFQVPQALSDSARDEAEKRSGESCFAKGIARDSTFVYVALGCAAHLNVPSEATGDAVPRAARFRYWGEHAYDLERANRFAYENSVRRLFPREVYERLKLVPRSEYLAALVARAKSR